jgi:hypothetical protein
LLTGPDSLVGQQRRSAREHSNKQLPTMDEPRSHVCDHGRLWCSPVRGEGGGGAQDAAAAPATPTPAAWWLPSDGRAARMRRRFRSVPPEEAVHIATHMHLRKEVDVDHVDEKVAAQRMRADHHCVTHPNARPDQNPRRRPAQQHRHADAANGVRQPASQREKKGDDDAATEKVSLETVSSSSRVEASCCRAVLLGPVPHSRTEVIRRLALLDALWQSGPGEDNFLCWATHCNAAACQQNGASLQLAPRTCTACPSQGRHKSPTTAVTATATN